MEQARLFIAIGISFAIFFLWSMFFAPQPPEQSAEVPQETAQAEPESEVAQPIAPSQPAPAGAPPQAEQTTATQPAQPAQVLRADRKISVETPLYRIVISERGAAVKSIVLKKYRETMAEDSPAKELLDAQTRGGSALLSYKDARDHNIENAIFSVDQNQDLIDASKEPRVVKFQHQTDSGIIIVKTYKFYPDSYLIDLSIGVINQGGNPVQGRLALVLRNITHEDAGGYGFAGPSGLINEHLEQIKIKDIEESPKTDGKIRWVAIEGRYFMTSVIPYEALAGEMLLEYKEGQLQNKLAFPTNELQPTERQDFKFKLFMGPKSLSLLRALNNDLDRAIDFGWVDFFAKPCLMLMNFIYKYIPNYGIAIIILTLITRGMFWPLAQKSYKSMGEMRKLQPLMQEIREKYKGDKARMNQEMMTLYKTYKINPMGGCLPMVIQLPVFFALYRMLYQAIELRHAPFFGWISDLSAPDRLFEFGFKIPFMDPPYGIPVLTIVMGASMILQQKMTPSPGDPTQAKMMMLMPVVFTFIFINFSSGLVLYWLVSNIFSMAQQFYTQKKAAS
jgi:YidC/Oxa1 family membrane protein insertase